MTPAQKAYYEKNKHKWRAYAAKYRKKYADALPSLRKKWRAAKVEKNRQRCRDWRAKNKERLAAYNAQWRAAHPGDLAKYAETTKRASKAWKRNNPQAVVEMAGRRRVAKTACANASVRFMRAIYTTARRISKCTGILHHVDHIIPLARGGLHHQSNLQILPAKINLRKGAKLAA